MLPFCFWVLLLNNGQKTLWCHSETAPLTFWMKNIFANFILQDIFHETFHSDFRWTYTQTQKNKNKKVKHMKLAIELSEYIEPCYYHTFL